MKLTDIDEKEKVEITNITPSPDTEKLHVLGMVEGCEICPIMKNDNAMLVDVRGCRYAIGNEVAECILVKRL
jgi:Fe2+ transport system protein FeoA